MLNIKNLLLFPFIFLLFPSFGIFFSATSSFSISFLFRLLSSFTVILLKSKEFILFIKNIYKQTPFKYLCCFFVWLIISSFIAIFLNGNTFSNLFNNVFFQFLFGCMALYLLTGFIFSKYFSLRFLIQFITFGYLIILYIGLIEFLADKFNITILQHMHDILINQRSVLIGFGEVANRVKSTFAEPSWLGQYLCVNIGIIFSLANSKYKIFKNTYLNKFVKYSIIPTTILIIILTKSPIWLIFAFLISFIYYKKFIINIKFLYFLICFIICFGILSLIFISKETEIDWQKSYLNRIYSTVTATNLQVFAIAEPSLATRVISYTASYKIFCKSPIIGVGYKNSERYAQSIFIKEELPLTVELKLNFDNATKNNNGKMKINSTIFFDLLAQTGIIGFIMFYLFLIKTILYTKKLSKSSSGLEKDFLNGLHFSLLTLLFTSYYEVLLTTAYIWFLFGICIAFYERNKIKKMERSY